MWRLKLGKRKFLPCGPAVTPAPCPLPPALQESIPFAVVGSCEVVRDGGNRPVRGRRYSWGTVEGE